MEDDKKQQEEIKRNEEIFQLVEKGLTLAWIGQKYNISRQRVQQIYERLKAKKEEKEPQEDESSNDSD